jgi:hypothetical protein
MNCFVIMPFAAGFDDVYESIKAGVEGALATSGGRCFRLDESRPAGRITDRLLKELQSASLCVADLTGARPNVMWETGYAMALGKPIIIVTQNLQDVPFDLKDMQSLHYDRGRLSGTLSGPLRRMIIDTVAAFQSPAAAAGSPPDPNAELVAELRDQVSELKSIVAQAVRFWSPGVPQPEPTTDEARRLAGLEGAWLSRVTGSHIYASVVNGELVAPYCHNGDSALVGVYHGWTMVGEHWFARFMWFDGSFSGFSFLKQESPDLVTGAWWHDYQLKEVDVTAPPPMNSGVPAAWERRRVAEYPAWATRFIEDVRREGLKNAMKRCSRW